MHGAWLSIFQRIFPHDLWRFSQADGQKTHGGVRGSGEYFSIQTERLLPSNSMKRCHVYVSRSRFVAMFIHEMTIDECRSARPVLIFSRLRRWQANAP